MGGAVPCTESVTVEVLNKTKLIEGGRCIVVRDRVSEDGDLAEVLSTTYAFGREPQLDRFVPRRLAELLCAGDCVVTRNFTPIEPGINARKYSLRPSAFSRLRRSRKPLWSLAVTAQVSMSVND